MRLIIVLLFALLLSACSTSGEVVYDDGELNRLPSHADELNKTSDRNLLREAVYQRKSGLVQMENVYESGY